MLTIPLNLLSNPSQPRGFADTKIRKIVEMAKWIGCQVSGIKEFPQIPQILRRQFSKIIHPVPVKLIEDNYHKLVVPAFFSE